MIDAVIPAFVEQWVCLFRYDDTPEEVTADLVVAWMIPLDDAPIPVTRYGGAERVDHAVVYARDRNSAIERAQKAIRREQEASL